MNDTAAVVERDQRAHIVDNALDLMSANGAAGTSMRQLAAACGLNVATIYHYFPSKAELLRSLIADRRYGERLATDRPPIDVSLEPRERFVALLTWLWEMALEEQRIWRLIVGESIRGDAVALSSASALVQVLDDALTQWFADLFPELDGEVAPISRIVRGQLFSFVVEELVTGLGREAIESRARDLAGVLFR